MPDPPLPPPGEQQTPDPEEQRCGDLSRRAAAGDPAAFDELHRDYYQVTERRLRRSGRVRTAEEDLQDAAQEAWTAFWRSVLAGDFRFTSRAAMIAYIVRRAVWVYIDRQEQAGHTVALDPDDGVFLAGPDADPHEVALAAALRADLAECVARLPEKERRVYEMSAAGASDQEIAAATGLAVVSVPVTRSRARKPVRACLKAKGW
jgi:RNA polymerase sigma factor (sigma-70 family)